MPDGWWERVEGDGVDIFLLGNGRFDFKVVGTSFQQEALERCAGPKSFEGCERECLAVLHHENENAFDKSAVAVAIGGMLVGHLSRANARAYRTMMAADGGALAACRALIVGGVLPEDFDDDNEGTNYGVRLDLRWPIETRRKKDQPCT